MIRDYDDDIIYSENGIVITKEDKEPLLEGFINKKFTSYIRRLEAFEIIKEHKLLNYILKNEKCANMYHLSKEEIKVLKEVLLWAKV